MFYWITPVTVLREVDRFRDPGRHAGVTRPVAPLSCYVLRILGELSIPRTYTTTELDSRTTYALIEGSDSKC